MAFDLKRLQRTARLYGCTVEVKGERLVFTSPTTGEHSIGVAESDDARAEAHLRVFLARQGKLRRLAKGDEGDDCCHAHCEQRGAIYGLQGFDGYVTACAEHAADLLFDAIFDDITPDGGDEPKPEPVPGPALLTLRADRVALGDRLQTDTGMREVVAVVLGPSTEARKVRITVEDVAAGPETGWRTTLALRAEEWVKVQREPPIASEP